MLEKIKQVALHADMKKAEDISLLDIREISVIADYFLIMTGMNPRHVMSLADEIEDKAYRLGFDLRGKEGKAQGKWILLDFDYFVVHVFDKESRNYYNLDKIWAGGEKIALDTEPMNL